LPVLIANRDRKTVDFKFGDIGETRTDFFFDPLVEIPNLGLVIDVGKRHHRNSVLDFDEFLLDLTADPAGRRIRGDQFGMVFFQSDQFVHQFVEFLVGDAGIVEDIVFVIIFIQ